MKVSEQQLLNFIMNEKMISIDTTNSWYEICPLLALFIFQHIPSSFLFSNVKYMKT